MKSLFVKMFEPFLVTFVASLHVLSSSAKLRVSSSWDFATTFAEWTPMFNKLLRSLEDKASTDRRSRLRGVPMQMTHSKSSLDEVATGIAVFDYRNKYLFLVFIDPTISKDEIQDEREIARNTSILKNRMRGAGPGGGRRRAAGKAMKSDGHGSASGTEYEITAAHR